MASEGYEISEKETIKDIRYLVCAHEGRFIRRYVRVGVPLYWEGITDSISVALHVALQTEEQEGFSGFESINLGENNDGGDVDYYKIKTRFLGSGEKFYTELYSDIENEIFKKLNWLDGFESLEKILLYLDGEYDGIRGNTWAYLIATGKLGEAHRSEERRNELIDRVKKFMELE